MAEIFYARVSTVEQNEARQLQCEAAQKADKVYLDKMSGKDTKRPQLQAMLEYVREGDTLTVESFSRLSRSTKDLLEIVDTLRRKNVRLVSLKESVDTETPQGKFVLTVFAAISEFEREQMLERQREGIAIAKAAGKYRGRKKKVVNMEWLLLAKAEQMTVAEACRRTGIQPSTYYRWLKAGRIKAK